MSTITDELKIKPAFKLWFEVNGEYVFGEGVCKLLERVKEKSSISAAAKSLRMSYRYAWGLIRNVEKHLGTRVVRTQKGGRQGGRTELTQTGLSLVSNYRNLQRIMTDACKLE